ncbi:MAG: nucleoside deaminase [Verrucomicrobia bacterium]|nr:nucleoside deaminase [Verrucomicrobiota bacterium]
MTWALKEAEKAYLAGEVPVGAVLVRDGSIIARGYNQVEMLKDATAHAEMICLTSGSVACDNWRLLDTTLYCTMEPCSMCLGAMLLARIKKLVWGAPDLRHGANGSWVDLLAQKHPTHTIEVVRGVEEAACADLMRRFFQERRNDRTIR